MEFVDTHCHIHFDDYGIDPLLAISNAQSAGVHRMMLVGCTLGDSEAAIDLAARHKELWATIGLHPHEGARYVSDGKALQHLRDLASRPRVVAIGETGLDYHYDNTSKTDQEKLLRFQLGLGLEHDLPFVFHVRDAFSDFWKIVDEYPSVRGVVHSFSATTTELHQALSRGLYIGLNGIMTFTKQDTQLEAAKAVPLERMVLETDAPFLTPKPFRGKVCEPKHVVNTAEFLAELRGDDLGKIAEITTNNAQSLFNLV